MASPFRFVDETGIYLCVTNGYIFVRTRLEHIDIDTMPVCENKGPVLDKSILPMLIVGSNDLQPVAFTELSELKYYNCEECNGTGKYIECKECNGTGEVEIQQIVYRHTYHATCDCLNCNGKSKEEFPCKECNGSGKLPTFQPVKMGIRWFNVHMLDKLKVLDNVLLAHDCLGTAYEQALSPCYFTFAEGDGLIMPVRNNT
jgi:hypothetical protein